MKLKKITMSDIKLFFRLRKIYFNNWKRKFIEVKNIFVNKILNHIAKKSELYRMTNIDLSNAKNNLYEYRKENEILAVRLSQIADKMCQIRVEKDNMYRHPERNYRVVIDFDSMMIEDLLIHGNDSDLIKCVGRYIGDKAAYEIKHLNYRRWERPAGARSEFNGYHTQPSFVSQPQAQ